MVRADYWNVSDDQVVDRTGKPLKHWMKLLKSFTAEKKKAAESVSFLQNDHAVPRYWARTLTTRYMKDARANEGRAGSSR